ncbi:MAG: N-acetylmuramoyl-L-alanine amidase family protein [Phocaeicola sp.]
MKRFIVHTLFTLCALCYLLPIFGQQAPNEGFTVVIDPGHGGRDPGAVGKKGREKDINLKVSLKLGKLIQENFGDVNVRYTRSSDVFIALDRRAEIANQAKADLFISIHTNAVAKQRSVRGTETYTLGLHRTADNLEVAKKENAVILIEDNYEQRYAGFNPNSAESYIIFEFLQDKNMEKSVAFGTHIQRQFKNRAQRIDKGVHQAGFLVLRATSMPSVLVELGYISNPDEEQYLLSEKGSTALAESLYHAFITYKKEHDQSSHTLAKRAVPTTSGRTATTARTATTPQTGGGNNAGGKKSITSNSGNSKASSTAKSQGKPLFKIQILTADKILPKGSKQFKGISPVGHYKEKGIYKYTYGESTDYNQIVRMRKTIQPKFKDAFIIAFKNGEKMNINQAIQEFKANKK